jgi:hypothetical protein
MKKEELVPKLANVLKEEWEREMKREKTIQGSIEDRM